MAKSDNDEILKIRIPPGMSQALEKLINCDKPKYLNRGDFAREAIRDKIRTESIKNGESPRIIDMLLKRGLKI